MANYRLSPDAEDDLYRIWVYGARKFGIVQADKYYRAFFHQFELITKQPFLFPSVDYIKENYRRCVSGVDSIYYRVIDGKVEIMAIIGSQDIENKL
ncbi:type II toxin-antitoxin system RelE/ParE family toxin [Kriegella aquimaris]|uniref:Toxin n=1 Tax=Kriegella aquimaris TaxID=192904 RepID=A0A1G9PY55_9FLAO|nr:type II toxin-antitoxin system RelE/ParE family toxin [Kriegella aquimaris]SDM03593.1 toxin ParE1/3/4 [Kriegella aquimaris]